MTCLPFGGFGTECVRKILAFRRSYPEDGCVSAVKLHGGRGAASTRTSVDTQEHTAASSTAVVDASPARILGLRRTISSAPVPEGHASGNAPRGPSPAQEAVDSIVVSDDAEALSYRVQR